MRHKIITVNNYDFFECSSAMQKSIRRGLEEEAMFWAVELFESNFAEYVWKRLRIISSEDVGLAEPHISSEIMSLYFLHKEQAKKKDDKNRPERLFLTHAVLMLCRAKKSRLVDWELIRHWNCHNQMLRPIPDYAFDKHNEKGRKLGRGWGHFFDDGTLLSPHSIQAGEDEARTRAMGAVTGECGNGLFD